MLAETRHSGGTSKIKETKPRAKTLNCSISIRWSSISDPNGKTHQQTQSSQEPPKPHLGTKPKPQKKTLHKLHNQKPSSKIHQNLQHLSPKTESWKISSTQSRSGYLKKANPRREKSENFSNFLAVSRAKLSSSKLTFPFRCLSLLSSLSVKVFWSGISVFFFSLSLLLRSGCRKRKRLKVQSWNREIWVIETYFFVRVGSCPNDADRADQTQSKTPSRYIVESDVTSSNQDICSSLLFFYVLFSFFFFLLYYKFIWKEEDSNLPFQKVKNYILIDSFLFGVFLKGNAFLFRI